MNSTAMGSSYQDELVAQSKHLQLDKHPQWRALLFVVTGWWHFNRSLIDSKGFFLAEKGKKRPDKELEATIRAFFAPSKKSDITKTGRNLHPQCRFPARYLWLKKTLKFDPTKLPEIHCPLIEEWIANLDVGGVSLVYSSNYLNNPASMFGHTFLRLHRRKTSHNQSAALLDHAVNFAASSGDANPVTYIFSGLTGLFRGVFSLLPYYVKVQEYSNYESRDLWEYRLNYAEEQIHLMILSLIEMGSQYIDYYFFDENCSYIILALLDIADPKYQLAKRYQFWVTPGDTLRSVTDIPGMVVNTQFRPSSFTRFIQRYEILDDDEKELMGRLVSNESVNSLAPLLDYSPDSQARVLDAALDYIDYDQKLAGSNESKSHTKIRNRLLSQRSQTKVKSLPYRKPPSHQQPTLAHGSTQLRIQGGQSSDFGPHSEISVRPSLHDLGAASYGYPESLQLKFLEANLRIDWETTNVYLKHFKVLEILSVPPWRQALKPISWTFGAEYESLPRCESSKEKCWRGHVQGGVGLTLAWFSGAHRWYSLAIVDLGFSDEDGQALHAGPGFTTGFVWRFSKRIKWVNEANFLWRLGRLPRTDWRFQSEFVLGLTQTFEFRLTGKYFNKNTEYGISANYYF